MSESNVARDQIKAYVDRILRMKEEAKAINADIREIYAEAKGNGFDKTVLGKLVTYVEKRQTDASAVLESESLFDLYLTAYDSAVGSVGTRRATHTHASEASAVAALRADPAMAIVEAATITPKPQPTKAAGSDLTSLAPREGQVAPSSDIGSPISNEAPMAIYGDSVDEPTGHLSESVEISPGGVQLSKDGRVDASPAVVNSAPNATPAGSVVDNVSGVTGGESAAPKYAEKGVVTWESTPPEGVERHAYSNAFGTLGQDAVVIADDIAKASAQPIVKIGNVILDGWARYMTARGAVGLDGHSTEYPVVQYDGTDPLLDCIRWNVAGRILSDKDKQTVVARLIALEPKRKAEILKAVAELAA